MTCQKPLGDCHRAAPVAGVACQAKLLVGCDDKGRVISSRVMTNRAALHDREREFARGLARSDDMYPVDVFHCIRNRALGVSAFYDGAPGSEGHDEKGLQK